MTSPVEPHGIPLDELSICLLYDGLSLHPDDERTAPLLTLFHDTLEQLPRHRNLQPLSCT